MKNSANSPFNREDEAKSKSRHEDPSIDNQGHEQGASKKRPFSNPKQSPLQAYQVDDNFALLKLPIYDVYKAIKVNPGVKRPEAKPHDPARP